MSDLSERTSARERSFGRLMVPGLVAAGVLTAFVLLWFQPQKLFIDDRVDEAVPGGPSDPSDATASTDPSRTAAPDEATSAAPTELARGVFVPLDHATIGTVRVLEDGDDGRVVRLEGFETENGPDLFVYLTTNRADGEDGAFDDDFINLGRLKGNQGDQNYEVPTDVDLARFRTVVIWCDRFNSPFGAADLSRA